MLCINAARWQARVSGIAGNEDSRDEQRRSSARLLNLHIAIYNMMHPPPIYDNIVPPLRRGPRRRDTQQKLIVEKNTPCSDIRASFLREFSAVLIGCSRKRIVASGQ